MKRLILAAAILISATAFASKPVRVACIGDSITHGDGLVDRENECYPAVLQTLLGDNYVVGNFGSSARTMVETGDHPYLLEHWYQKAKAFMPDIVTITLGTNDTKAINWDPEQYRRSYDRMIRDLKALPTHPDIYVCLPPPVSVDKWGINDSTLVAGVLPIIKYIAGHHWLEIIDLYSPLEGMPQLYSDGIHPNPAGARIIAQTMKAAFEDNGWSSVPGKRVLFVGDSITDGDWGKADAKPAGQRNHYDMNHIFGHGFVQNCAAYFMANSPKECYHFYNRGLSGDRLPGLVARWDNDVLAVQPDVVSILIGVNDSSGHSPEDFDFVEWENQYRSLVARTLAADPQCRIVLCTPFLEKRGAVGRMDNYDARRQVVERLGEIVRRIAADNSLVCVDFAPLMSRLVQTDRSGDRNYWTWDGVHPTMPAHLKMSELWIRQVRKARILK